MEDKDLLDQKIGAEGLVTIKYIDNKLVMEVGYDGKGADAGMFIKVEPGYFLDQLKEVIPGTLDDKIIDMLKAAFL